VTEKRRLAGWPLRIARILAFLTVILITVGVYLLRDEIENFEAYGYPGIFILSLLANATIFFPAPSVALSFAMGAVLNPVGVAIAAGLGATFGELTGYLVGFSGQGIVERAKFYATLEDLTDRFGGWLIMFLAFIPNPLFDLAGAVAGATGFPVLSFLFWTSIGKIFKMLIFALAGAAWLDLIIDYFRQLIPQLG